MRKKTIPIAKQCKTNVTTNLYNAPTHNKLDNRLHHVHDLSIVSIEWNIKEPIA